VLCSLDAPDARFREEIGLERAEPTGDGAAPTGDGAGAGTEQVAVLEQQVPVDEVTEVPREQLVLAGGVSLGVQASASMLSRDQEAVSVGQPTIDLSVGQMDLEKGQEEQAAPLLDLNISCDMQENDCRALQIQQRIEKQRGVINVLGLADGRMNKEAHEHSGLRTGTRGVVCLAVPLRKSLLCTPQARTKGAHSRKCVVGEETGMVQGDKRNCKDSVKGLLGHSLVDQATNMLLSTVGLPTEKNGGTRCGGKTTG
jgi:hypothetical protein